MHTVDSVPLTNLNDLRILLHTARHRIVAILRTGSLSARTISERLTMRRSSVYYHLRLLESHGFVASVVERSERGAERVYSVVARNFVVQRDEMLARVNRKVLNAAQAEILSHAARDLRDQAPDLRGSAHDVLVARTFVRIGPEQRAEVRARLSDMFQSIASIDGEGTEVLEIVVALFPV